jgi:hydrogenase/urease accessory protein HupE
MDDMDLLLELDEDLDDTVNQLEILNAEARITEYVVGRTRIIIDNVEVDPVFQGSTTWLDSDDFPYLEVQVNYILIDSLNTIDITLRFLTDLYPDHRTLAELNVAEEQYQFVFQRENTWSLERNSSSRWDSAGEFILFGMEHIFTGYDHLLFLLGLLLVGSGLRNLIGVVTSFTVAHSVTLALATLGLVQPIGWIVEAAIALSIVYVGVENLLVKDIKRRWLLAFVFGLVHGFGFAGLLQEMDLESAGMLLSLLTFNLGVEIGQVLVVALAWPFLLQLAKSRYREQIIRYVSLLITTFGLIWFFERII